MLLEIQISRKGIEILWKVCENVFFNITLKFEIILMVG